MSRTTEIRQALEAAVAEITTDARAMSAGTKYDEGVEQFSLRVLLGDPEDSELVERLDEMLDNEGERSIRVALEDDPDLGGALNSLYVVRHSGHRLYPVGQSLVLGAEWLINVT